MNYKEKISLKNAIEFIVDNRGKTVPTSDQGIALIATNCINNISLFPEFKNVRYISGETFNNWFRAHPKPDDIIFTLKGSQNGAACLVPKIVNFAIAQDMVALRANKKIMDPYFLLAVLRSKEVQYSIKSLDVSDVIPHLKKGDFDKLLLPKPSLEIQKSIGQIFITLERKIELNRQMNQTLEAIAQALFKSWFVDFDPVMDNMLAAGNPIPEELEAMAEKRQLVPDSKKLLHTNPALAAQFPSAFEYNEVLDKWVPEGWEVKKLQELVNVKYGKDHKKLGDGLIPCYGSGGVMRFVNKALFESESILIPRKGTLDNVMYVNKPFWSVDTMFYTVMNQENFVKYFFYVVNRLNFSEMNEGSAVPSMTTAQLNSMDILLPSSKCLSTFESLISKYFSKKEGNEIQSETLTQLRDRLLPELISGRVRVNK